MYKRKMNRLSSGSSSSSSQYSPNHRKTSKHNKNNLTTDEKFDNISTRKNLKRSRCRSLSSPEFSEKQSKRSKHIVTETEIENVQNNASSRKKSKRSRPDISSTPETSPGQSHIKSQIINTKISKEKAKEDDNSVQIISDDFETSENEKINVATKKKGKYEKYFYIEKKIDGTKEGSCLICGKDKKGNFLKVIKMTKSNTSGVKSHLNNTHKKEYEELFSKEMRSTLRNTKQLEIDVCFQVCVSFIILNYFKILFYYIK